MADITLKAEQCFAMEAIYNHQDVVVWLPTANGRSLCFIKSIRKRHKISLAICMHHSCHYVIISILINMHVQTECTRPSPPILEGLGTRLP